MKAAQEELLECVAPLRDMAPSEPEAAAAAVDPRYLLVGRSTNRRRRQVGFRFVSQEALPFRTLMVKLRVSKGIRRKNKWKQALRYELAD